MKKVERVGIYISLAVILYLLIPLNSILHYTTENGTITIIRRKSMFDGGVYFTTGEFNHLFLLPDHYLKPEIIDSGIDSYYEIVVDVGSRPMVFYNWGYRIDTVNFNIKARFERPESIGEWNMMKKDTSGRYLLFH